MSSGSMVRGEKAALAAVVRRPGAPPVATAVTCWSTRKRTRGVRWGLKEMDEGGGGAHRGREVVAVAAALIPGGVATVPVVVDMS
jgi:hypothetical protein